MRQTIETAIRRTQKLERDIAIISASGTETQQGLAADCAEHRRQLANKLRHIEQIGTLSEGAERSRKINATPSRMSELIAQTNSAESRDRYEASMKAGDFNGDEFRDIEQCSRELQSPERRELGGNEYRPEKDDINPISDKAYSADLIRRENVELWRSYDRRKNWLGCGLACIAAGAILAGIKIWFTYFQP